MSAQIKAGLFIAEGSSDRPLSKLVENLFWDRDCHVRLSEPDFAFLPKVKKDVASRVEAGVALMDEQVDLVVVHRDADSDGLDARVEEIRQAVLDSLPRNPPLVPVVPIKMTEAWLLLDQSAIRKVAGNPKGKDSLDLPSVSAVERLADPKKLLSETLLKASAVRGRRREKLKNRFNDHRRQLLQQLDRHGPVTRLEAWKRLEKDVDAAAQVLLK